jgi:hypothetical protein
MHLHPIIHQTAIIFAEGAAYGAAYGALINPVMGVGAGAVLGAVAHPASILVDRVIIDRPALAFSQLLDRIKMIERLWVKTIATISVAFASAVLVLSSITVPSYAGLYAGKYALAALGFKATIAPSLSLAAKFILAHFACNLGVILAISSVKALWNRTFPRADQGQLAVVR